MADEPTKLLAEWFWVDRWMGSSAFLMPLEPRGLYREMLSQAWRRGAKLPNNHVAIQRAVACTPEEWARCWPEIARYWRVDGENLVNDTQVAIYADAMARQERRSTAGKAGAEARWSQRNAIAYADAHAIAPAEHVPTQWPPSPSLSQVQTETDLSSPVAPTPTKVPRARRKPDPLIAKLSLKLIRPKKWCAEAISGLRTNGMTSEALSAAIDAHGKKGMRVEDWVTAVTGYHPPPRKDPPRGRATPPLFQAKPPAEPKPPAAANVFSKFNDLTKNPPIQETGS